MSEFLYTLPNGQRIDPLLVSSVSDATVKLADHQHIPIFPVSEATRVSTELVRLRYVLQGKYPIDQDEIILPHGGIAKAKDISRLRVVRRPTDDTYCVSSMIPGKIETLGVYTTRTIATNVLIGIEEQCLAILNRHTSAVDTRSKSDRYTYVLPNGNRVDPLEVRSVRLRPLSTISGDGHRVEVITSCNQTQHVILAASATLAMEAGLIAHRIGIDIRSLQSLLTQYGRTADEVILPNGIAINAATVQSIRVVDATDKYRSLGHLLIVHTVGQIPRTCVRYYETADIANKVRTELLEKLDIIQSSLGTKLQIATSTQKHSDPEYAMISTNALIVFPTGTSLDPRFICGITRGNRNGPHQTDVFCRLAHGDAIHIATLSDADSALEYLNRVAHALNQFKAGAWTIDALQHAVTIVTDKDKFDSPACVMSTDQHGRAILTFPSGAQLPVSACTDEMAIDGTNVLLWASGQWTIVATGLTAEQAEQYIKSAKKSIEQQKSDHAAPNDIHDAFIFPSGKMIGEIFPQDRVNISWPGTVMYRNRHSEVAVTPPMENSQARRYRETLYHAFRWYLRGDRSHAMRQQLQRYITAEYRKIAKNSIGQVDVDLPKSAMIKCANGLSIDPNLTLSFAVCAVSGDAGGHDVYANCYNNACPTVGTFADAESASCYADMLNTNLKRYQERAITAQTLADRVALVNTAIRGTLENKNYTEQADAPTTTNKAPRWEMRIQTIPEGNSYQGISILVRANWCEGLDIGRLKKIGAELKMGNAEERAIGRLIAQLTPAEKQ